MVRTILNGALKPAEQSNPLIGVEAVNIEENLIHTMAAYFDLLDLENAWKHDQPTTVDINGHETRFRKKSEVTESRQYVERDLRGFTNVLRDK